MKDEEANIAAMENFMTVAQQETSTTSTLSEELTQELPAMAAGVLAAVVLFVLLAIGGVFILGVLLDRRQQKILESKQRLPRQRRRNVAVDVESEVADITSHMEPSAESLPPVYATGYIRPA